MTVNELLVKFELDYDRHVLRFPDVKQSLILKIFDKDNRYCEAAYEMADESPHSVKLFSFDRLRQDGITKETIDLAKRYAIALMQHRYVDEITYGGEYTMEAKRVFAEIERQEPMWYYCCNDVRGWEGTCCLKHIGTDTTASIERKSDGWWLVLSEDGKQIWKSLVCDADAPVSQVQKMADENMAYHMDHPMEPAVLPEFEVETPIGKIRAMESPDRNNPGVILLFLDECGTEVSSCVLEYAAHKKCMSARICTPKGGPESPGIIVGMS